jgi:hypothetical protein
MLSLRSQVRVDHRSSTDRDDKPSGIVNDPNDRSGEGRDPRYIIDLLARIVTVSVETMKVVDTLPALDIREPARTADEPTQGNSRAENQPPAEN